MGSGISAPLSLDSISMTIFAHKLIANCVIGGFYLLLCAAAMGQELKILTNHIGYEPHESKHAVVLGYASDIVTDFKILDGDKKEVFSGTATKVGPVDQWRNWIFWTLDFSPLEQEGNYIVQCDTIHGPVRSFPFMIQNELLERNTLSNTIYYFKLQRNSGQRERADYHLQFEDSADSSKTCDLHGGWADATGDYGKHLSHLSFSTYFNPQHIPLTTWVLFKCNAELNRRGSDNFRLYKQRLIDEALFGADYLCRSKTPGGSFFRSVDDPGGNDPEKRFVAKDGSGGIIKKTKNPNPLQAGDLSGISPYFDYEIGFRAGGAMSIAALALASTQKVSGEYSSDQYLHAARLAYEFLSKYNLYYTNDGKENIIDDYCVLIAATELWNATKEGRYKADADLRADKLLARMTDKGYWRADDGDRPFFHAADAGLPVVALLNYYPSGDAEMQSRILRTVKKSLTYEMNTDWRSAEPVRVCAAACSK